jgi:DNA-binding Lrp family transcriptional regulator
MTTELDELDRQILASLKRDGRMGAADLARELQQPRTTIAERIKRLEERKVILGYTARVNNAELGEGVVSFVMASFTPASGTSQKEVAKRIARLHGVEEVFVISGEWDILAKVRGSSIESIGELVLEKIRTTPGVARTLTMASFAAIREGEG